MTDQNTLTERYIDAAMRTVPEKQRADLAAELRASIADQIDARLDAGEPHDTAERAVLTELGDPDKLAAGYTDRPLWLIGPRYYLDWKRLLKLLLAIVPACAAFGVALGQVLSGASVGEVFGTVISTVLAVVVHLAFWTTLVFVILERTGHATMDPSRWTPDRLPEPRDTGTRFADLVGTLVFLAVAVAAVLWDHFLGLAYIGGRWMPALSPDLWPWWIALLFVLMAAQAAVGVAAFVRRGWSLALAAANGILNLAVAIPAIVLLWEGRLVNPAVTAALVDAAGPGVFGAGGVVTVIVGFAIAVIAIWGAVDGFLKARRARRTSAHG